MAEVKWIRMTDKLPEDGKKLLVLSDRGTISTKVYRKRDEGKMLSSGGRLDGFYTTNTVYWAELPKPPEGFLEARNRLETRKLEAEILRLKEKLRKLQDAEKEINDDKNVSPVEGR